MRVSNDLIAATQGVAGLLNTEEIDMTHLRFLGVTAEIVAANPANKTFVAGDVNTTTDVVTVTAHGFLTGTLVTLTTTGGLPAGLATSTNYYVIVLTANTIKFASSQANALAGTAIDLTTAGTGTQTIVVTTTIAGSVKLQKNNEPENPVGASAPNTPVWVDVGSSSQNFSGTTTLIWDYDGIANRSIRAVVTVTSGTVTARIRYNAKGY